VAQCWASSLVGVDSESLAVATQFANDHDHDLDFPRDLSGCAANSARERQEEQRARCLPPSSAMAVLTTDPQIDAAVERSEQLRLA